MPFDVICECGTRLRLSDQAAGKTGRCPKCKGVIEIPAPASDFRMPRIALDNEDDPFVEPEAPPAPRRAPIPKPPIALPPGSDLDPDPPPVAPARYVYRMVQAAPVVEIYDRTPMGEQAALYLENLVNGMARQGWEFFRVDNMAIHVNPGCFAAMFGVKAETTTYLVITFRRELLPI